MTDKEYEEFRKWWRSKWPLSAPDRISAEKYLEYLVELKKSTKEGNC